MAALQDVALPEPRAYRQAGHATMSYLIRKGFTDKHVPVDRSMILPAFQHLTLADRGPDWAEITWGLGSLITVPQVLLAGYLAEHLQAQRPLAISPTTSPLTEKAWNLLGGLIEEMGLDDPVKRDAQATEQLQEIYRYVEENIRLHCGAVDALAQALLQHKTISEQQVFALLDHHMPASLRAQAQQRLGRTIEENIRALHRRN